MQVQDGIAVAASAAMLRGEDRHHGQVKVRVVCLRTWLGREPELSLIRALSCQFGAAAGAYMRLGHVGGGG